MKNCRSMFSLGAMLALSGCVVGSGPCLWLRVPRTFTGHLHFRDFPSSAGIDNVPILVLDKTQYIYAPAQSFHCLAANDVQLLGVPEFPRNMGEDSHISVEGKVLDGVARGQHTRFVLDVNNLGLLVAPPN